jgi:predicted ATPase
LRRIDVGPLSRSAVEELATANGLEPEQVYRLTGGNAFFVTEVVGQAGSASVPPSARDAVLARVAGLGGATRRCLETASLLGATLDTALLGELCPAVADALDEILATGILTSDGPLLRFRHEISRVAVEEQIAPHRRGPLHAQILTALLDRAPEDHARLAHHADHASDSPAVLRRAPLPVGRRHAWRRTARRRPSSSAPCDTRMTHRPRRGPPSSTSSRRS